MIPTLGNSLRAFQHIGIYIYMGISHLFRCIIFNKGAPGETFEVFMDLLFFLNDFARFECGFVWLFIVLFDFKIILFEFHPAEIVHANK